MRENKWFIGSLIGFFVTLLCCVTPLLVVLLGLVGLGAWIGYLDYVLIPFLIGFMLIAVGAYKRRKRTSSKDCCS
ncbi:mercury resistance system transport protein MerF [Pontibacillus sp. HMF3514]|uniref:mercury resistance system transport protein MerF n=1 Tax=Pontibacillus sp. HMF3514 TaxID=2692425 RepID=UPI00131F48AB|nr:mercury resistance system transport protein MerF [Pontibacillus sp. HMF3514]QHE51548.1 mercury resistance system transport protein MerF [Pontibacillus sp. HMF3514]